MFFLPKVDNVLNLAMPPRRNGKSIDVDQEQLECLANATKPQKFREWIMNGISYQAELLSRGGTSMVSIILPSFYDGV